MIYILSIAFQVAGALLLMINSLSTKREKVIKRFASSKIIFRHNNTGEISYNEEALRDEYRNAYLNKLAFSYIAVGYIIGVFGEIGDGSRVCIALLIIGIASVIIGASYLSIWFVLKYNKEINREITNEELNSLGIEPDLEDIPNHLIDALFPSPKTNLKESTAESVAHNSDIDKLFKKSKK